MHSAQDWNTIVFADTESALAAKSQETLCDMFRFAKDNVQCLFTYCFVCGNRPLEPRHRLRLERVCGGEIYRQPTLDVSPVGVAVLIARVPGCPPLPRHTDLEAKRALWWNDARNTAIAGLATAITSRNQTFARQSGLLKLLPSGTDRTVAILAESTAHGNKLLENLPGWRLQHEVPALGDVAGGRSHMPVGDHCVATFVYAQRNGVAVDVLIRADGATDWPLSTDLFSCRAYRTDSQAVVIDVLDAAGGGDTRFQRRVQDYEQRGWCVEGPVDVVLGKRAKQHGTIHRRRLNPR